MQNQCDSYRKVENSNVKYRHFRVAYKWTNIFDNISIALANG